MRSPHPALTLLAVASLALPALVLASAVAPLTTFSNGTVADAEEINKNFVALKEAVDDNDERLSHFKFVDGKVGVGATTPAAALDLGSGALRFGGRTVKRITSCQYSGAATVISTNSCRRAWQASDCDNGLPAGGCLAFLSRAQHSGADEDWKASTPAQLPPSGGIEWWNGSGCTNVGVDIAAVYFCDQ